MKKIVNISGMQCAHCAQAVETALEKIENVKSVKVNLDENKAEIYSDTQISEPQIVNAIQDIGFDVIEIV